jgi:hypothetical protein
MKRGLLLSGSLLIFCCCFAVGAHAQTIGGACATTGIVTLTGANPGEMLYCNGSNLWDLAEAYSSTGSVGIGSTSPVDSLDISQKTDAVSLPSGTSAQRPTGANGMLRYNSTVPQVEAYYSGAWQALGGGASSTITLGTSATATNPQRSGQAGTGLFSATTNTVSIAQNGTDVADLNSTGENLLTGYLQLGSDTGLWDDVTNSNLAVGPTALPSTISQSGGGDNGTEDTAVGEGALDYNTTGYFNTAVGAYALSVNTAGDNNTAVGDNALALNDIGNNNVAIGDEALYTNTGVDNTAVGYSALTSNTTGYGNTAVGYGSLTANTIAAANTAVGYGALASNTTGGNSAALGYDALSHNTIGSFNMGIGPFALGSNTTGGNNSAIGYSALVVNTSGSNNLAIGSNALYNNSFGNANIGIGSGAMNINTTGTNNTAIGYAVASTTLNGGSNNILIGTSSAVDTPAAGTNNFLNIGNVIFATGMTGTVSSPAGLVGIGSASPAVSLDISQKTDAVSLPGGTSAQRPSAVAGMIRYNSGTPGIEAYYDSTWNSLGGGSSYGALSTFLTSATTITATSFTTTNLVLPTIPASTTVRGSCNINWQMSTNGVNATWGMGMNNTPTDLYVISTIYTGAASSVTISSYTIASTTTTAVSAAAEATTANSMRKASFDFVLVTGSNPVTLTLYGEVASAATLTVEPGSSCGWLP